MISYFCDGVRTSVVSIHHHHYPSDSGSSSSSSCSRTISINSKYHYYHKIQKMKSKILVGHHYSVETVSNYTRTTTTSSSRVNVIVALVASAILMFSSATALAAAAAANAITNDPYATGTESTLGNIPQLLSGSDDKCESTATIDCSNKGIKRIQRPKSRKAESCTRNCVTTCVRGGSGEGPINAIRPLVVFKQGFRSRQYCLVECSDICNLMKENADR